LRGDGRFVEIRKIPYMETSFEDDITLAIFQYSHNLYLEERTQSLVLRIDADLR